MEKYRRSQLRRFIIDVVHRRETAPEDYGLTMTEARDIAGKVRLIYYIAKRKTEETLQQKESSGDAL